MSTSEGQSDDTLAPGSTLGRYEVGRLLGRGGMGAVYEAVHRDLKKRVAIKVLSATLASEDAKQRFLREGEAASRISHPNVVDVTDVGVEGALSYLVMEFLEGEDLSNRLAREGSLSPRDAADILLPVCAGLAVAHDEGVVHRDLKPENIFLVRQRQGGVEPKVLDFGISKLTGRNAMAMTGTIATFGTPYYMPPEQVRGARQADQRSDVYALGVVLYECVTGRRPFEADNIYSMLHAIGGGEYPSPRTVRPELPLELEATIVRAMRLDPADRFPSVRHLAVALLPFASDKSRVVWSETFGVTDNPLVATVPPVPGAPNVPTGRKVSSVSGTRILPPGGSSPSSGRSLSPSRGTTLGSATGQHLDLIAPPRSRKGAVLGGVVAVGVLATVGVLLLRPSPPHTVEPPAAAEEAASASHAAPPHHPTYRVEVDADPPTATLEIDGVPTGARVLRRDFPADGREHRLIGRATGYRDAVVTFIDAPPDPRLSLEPLAPAATAPPREGASSTSPGSHVRAHHHQKPTSSPSVDPEASPSKSHAPVID
jgi:eukaryotic-like serine/threonine-protein kinase